MKQKKSVSRYMYPLELSKEQEAHGPHRSPEKTVQIIKQI